MSKDIDTTIYLLVNKELHSFGSKDEAVDSILSDYTLQKLDNPKASYTVQAANQGAVKDISFVVEEAISKALDSIYSPPKAGLADIFNFSKIAKDLGVTLKPVVKAEIKPESKQALTTHKSGLKSLMEM